MSEAKKWRELCEDINNLPEGRTIQLLNYSFEVRNGLEKELSILHARPLTLKKITQKEYEIITGNYDSLPQVTSYIQITKEWQLSPEEEPTSLTAKLANRRGYKAHIF